MTSTAIQTVRARQILDSRGRPTVEVEIALANGLVARASSPSGASTGRAEAIELRDGGEAWQGRGVSKAVSNVREEIAPLLIGRDPVDQVGIDTVMAEADRTGNWGRLGGNAVLAVSLATARAAALTQGQPLYRRFADLAESNPSMPMPMVNILSGGLHAGRGMDVQDFLVIPVGAKSYSEALDWVCRIRATATDLCAARGLPTLLADEGGLSPGLETTEEGLALMVESFEKAGLKPGDEVAIALDIAASCLRLDDGNYEFARAGEKCSSSQMIAMQARWADKYPVVSIEDGLGEDDWEHWPLLTKRLSTIQLVGDDLFATQADLIQRGADAKIANAALIKVNQNGTVSGSIDAIRTARKAGYAHIVSARSGETEDDFLADLSVGVGAGQIKVGSVRNSERQAKYNQLLRIEDAGLPWAGRASLAPL